MQQISLSTVHFMQSVAETFSQRLKRLPKPRKIRYAKHFQL